MLAHKTALTLRVNARHMNRTLALDVSHDLRHRIFRWNGDHHMDVVRHQMPFFDPAFLLARKPLEHFSKLRSIAEIPHRVLGGSRSEVSPVDFMKRQTSTATPAKPGELSLRFR